MNSYAISSVSACSFLCTYVGASHLGALRNSSLSLGSAGSVLSPGSSTLWLLHPQCSLLLLCGSSPPEGPEPAPDGAISNCCVSCRSWSSFLPRGKLAVPCGHGGVYFLLVLSTLLPTLSQACSLGGLSPSLLFHCRAQAGNPKKSHVSFPSRTCGSAQAKLLP